MTRHSTWKWLVPVAAGLVVLVGAIGFSDTKPPAPVASTKPRENPPRKSPTRGEKNMSVTHDQNSVQHASTANFNKMVLKSPVPVLVDFYADWCGPCRRLAPILDQLAAENPDAKIVKVNVDHNPELAMRYGVDSIPSVKLFNDGAVQDEIVGLASKSQLQALLTR